MFSFIKLMKLYFKKPMDTHCPFGLRPIGPCTNWSFVQLDHLLIGHVHSPPKMNWAGLAHGQPAQLTPLELTTSGQRGELLKSILVCRLVEEAVELLKRSPSDYAS